MKLRNAQKPELEDSASTGADNGAQEPGQEGARLEGWGLGVVVREAAAGLKSEVWKDGLTLPIAF